MRASLAIFVALLAGGAADAAAPRMKVWDLPLGASIAEMPAPIEFKAYACGSNGGPPLKRLAGWADFAECPAGADGLHEIYFEYDDEAEFVARAYEDITLARDVGTVDKSFPVVTSALFDDDGILVGIRLVTDARNEKQVFNEWAGLRERQDHYLLGAYLAGQFNMVAERDCVTTPLAEGESEISGMFVKQRCERVDEAANRRYVIEQRYLRKEGQSGRDPHTGALTSGQYESVARGEVYLARY